MINKSLLKIGKKLLIEIKIVDKLKIIFNSKNAIPANLPYIKNEATH